MTEMKTLLSTQLKCFCLASGLLFAACGPKGAPAAAPAPGASAGSALVAAPSASPAAANGYKSIFKTNPPEQWASIYGNWWVKDGSYRQDDSNLEGARTMLQLPESTCYTFAATGRKPSGSDALLLIFKYQGKYVWWVIDDSMSSSYVSQIADKRETERRFRLEKDRFYKFKLIVNKEHATGWIDDTQFWSIRRSPDEVQGLDVANKNTGKDLTGLVGLASWHSSVEFTEVAVTPECK